MLLRLILPGVFSLAPGADRDPPPPLQADEVLALLRERWQASHGLQLVQRHGRLYFQVMWNHLEQQSFPLSAAEYQEALAELVATLNGLGVAEQVRTWLSTTRDRPRLGRALSLPLELPPGRASEFLL
ncbi:MAG: DUF3067 family protein [Cyanobium sp.]